MNIVKRLVRSVIRFFVVWFIDTVSLLVTAWILPGIDIHVNGISVVVVVTGADFVLGFVNFLIRPLLLLIALPLGWIAVFLAGFFINAVVLLLTASLMPGMEVSSFGQAFLGGLILSLVNTILITILAIDDEDSLYENLVQRQAARRAGKATESDSRGIVMLETDGLSYQRIKKAIADGYMPTLKQMMEEEGYRLTLVDCGVPPTTPACQAGILQGNNPNIPAFRWLDKQTGRMLAGGQAAAEVEPILSDGNGLLRGGSSIGNMFSGDAEKAILTFSKLVLRGTTFGRLGPNGAGKTTTIRMILDIIRPDSGEIRVLGKTHGDGVRRHVGYLPEERGMYPKMKVIEVLEFLGSLKGASPSAARKEAKGWLERLDLPTWADKKVEELSKGMQQKVQFLGTIVHDPEVLILDEPFSGLDPINVVLLKDFLVDFKKQGKTVVFSTHVMEQAEKLCDRIALLYRGKKLLDGTVKEVKEAYRDRAPLPPPVEREREREKIFIKAVEESGLAAPTSEELR